MKRKILIVDDEIDYLKLFQEFLTLRGYEVYCEAEPKRAVERFRQVRPDIVFLDWDMPHINGGELFQILQVSSPGQQVIFISVHPVERLQQDRYTRGAADYINKAEGLEQITTCLSKHLER